MQSIGIPMDFYYIAKINPSDYRVERELIVLFAEEFLGKELSDATVNFKGEEIEFELAIGFEEEEHMLEFFIALAKNFRKV